jgi:hypothetical protein
MTIVKQTDQFGVDTVGAGSTVFGHARNGGTIDVLAGPKGQTSFGYAYSATGVVRASDKGATAFGCAYGGQILADGIGSTVHGYAFKSFAGVGGIIQAVTTGGTAWGHAGLGSKILATGLAATAFGRSDQTSIINATGPGAVAAGFATTGQIKADGPGSFAFGQAAVGQSIIASGDGSGQFAPGTNDVANSFAIGPAMRLNSAVPATAKKRDGDLWVDPATNLMMARSNAIDVPIAPSSGQHTWFVADAAGLAALEAARPGNGVAVGDVVVVKTPFSISEVTV